MNISRGGIFIATKSPKPVGTHLQVRVLVLASSGETGLSDHPRRGTGVVDARVRSVTAGQGARHGDQVHATRRREPGRGRPRARGAPARPSGACPRWKKEDDEPSRRPRWPPRATAETPTLPESPIRATPTAPPVEIPASSISPPLISPPVVPGRRPLVRRDDAPNEGLPRPLAVDTLQALRRGSREEVTKPISVEAAEAEAEAERSKETVLPPTSAGAGAATSQADRQARSRPRDSRARFVARDSAAAELEQMARDWGVTGEEQICARSSAATAAVSSRRRRSWSGCCASRSAAGPPTMQEALAGLRELLSRHAPVRWRLIARPRSRCRRRVR